MLTQLPETQVAERLAFCTFCEGVVPFAELDEPARSAAPGVPGATRHRHRSYGRQEALRCIRCGHIYRRVDPAAQGMRRAMRFLCYAGASALALIMSGLSLAAGTPKRPGAALQLVLMMGLTGAMTLGCLARSLWLRAKASRFESLEPYELMDLERRLCPGMVRSDLIEELARRGWRPGKIRAVLSSLEPDSRLG